MSDILPSSTSTQFSEAAIFSRTVERSGDISRELAQHWLSLNISETDQQRVRLLLEKNSSGELTESERTELANLNHVADLISLWHSRARLALKER